jgi:hypothetical protein
LIQMLPTDEPITKKNGYYFLHPTKAGPEFALDNQVSAKKFANTLVSVQGNFDYDKNKILVTKIQPAKAEVSTVKVTELHPGSKTVDSANGNLDAARLCYG